MGLYFVTARELSARPLVEIVQTAIAGGVEWVQIREKDLTTPELIELARPIRDVCQAQGVKWIINSNLEVADTLEADGVHLGYGGLTIAQARQTLGEAKLIGVSVHSLNEAMRAEEAGADYLIVGHIFSTSCKPGLVPRGVEFLRQVTHTVDIPVFAIGGMTPEVVPLILEARAYGVAVRSGIMTADDPKLMASQFQLFLSKYKGVK